MLCNFHAFRSTHLHFCTLIFTILFPSRQGDVRHEITFGKYETRPLRAPQSHFQTLAIMAAENSTNSLDDEMTALALQLEEVNIGNPRTKGKYPVGNPPDSTFAFDSFKAEVQAHLDFLKDRHLAVHLDSREEFSDEDALEIQPTDHSSTSYDAASRFDVSDNESEAEPSMTYTERQAKTLGKLIEEHPCSVCYEDFKAASLFTLDCGDRYCLGCLKGLFLRATADEMLFPPRCCREPIPLEVIRAKLSTNELSAFQDAEIEFSSTNRTYCSYPGCNRFIPPDWIEADRAECRRCSAETCVLCKNAYHSNSDCPEDPNLQATLSLADEQKWQRCYACRSMVEMSLGCNHMT